MPFHLLVLLYHSNTLSLGTELSVRNTTKILSPSPFEGLQASVLCQSVAVGTTAPSVSGPLSSTPLKGLRPEKRPRLEFEEEVEDVSYAGTDPQDLTFDPAQSVTMETESSQLE